MSHDWMRKRLLSNVHSHETEKERRYKQGLIRCKLLFDNSLAEMEKLARVRILVGQFRYEDPQGPSGVKEAPKYIERLKKKLVSYNQTGNKEMLVDSLNYILLEWADPQHPDAHFESTDRNEV